MAKVNIKECFQIALSFGFFQALMPFLGWLLGSQFEHQIKAFDHWVAFGLLAFIGMKMIQEAVKGEDACDAVCKPLTAKELIVLSVATSIDALAAGIVFAIEGSAIYMPIAVIGITTFILSLAGSLFGNKVGATFKNKAQIAGGAVLVAIGLKILLEHMGIIAL